MRKGFAHQLRRNREMKGLYPPPPGDLGPDVEFSCTQCGHEEYRSREEQHDPSHGLPKKTCSQCGNLMFYHFPLPDLHREPNPDDPEKKY